MIRRSIEEIKPLENVRIGLNKEISFSDIIVLIENYNKDEKTKELM